MSGAIRAILLALALFAASTGGAAAADLTDLAFEPHPGAALPLSATLIDESGRGVELGSFFTKKPVILVLDYLRCKTLCGVTLHSLFATLRQMPQLAGRDFEMVSVSIDPRDTPADSAKAKAKYLSVYGRNQGVSGIHFLTGSKAAVGAVARAVGFRYRYDPALDQYIHPAGFVVASPSGAISHYLLGVAPTPSQLTAALADAEENRAVGPLQKLVLLCHIAGRPLSRFTVPILGAFILADLAAGGAVLAVFLAIRRRRG